MSVLYYNQICHDTGERLQKTLEAEISTEKIEIFQSIEELSKRLSKTKRGQGIAILIISAMTEFYELYSFKSLLNDIRIILILPERSSEIITAGYKLRPRFISYMDSDFKAVASVLKRMLALVDEKTIAMECPYEVINEAPPYSFSERARSEGNKKMDNMNYKEIGARHE
jgi:hypothetical protein